MKQNLRLFALIMTVIMLLPMAVACTSKEAATTAGSIASTGKQTTASSVTTTEKNQTTVPSGGPTESITTGNDGPITTTPDVTDGTTGREDLTTPPVTTPPVTTHPVTTPPMTTAPDMTVYDIYYEYDGGIDPGNPEIYTAEDEIRLAVPLRAGYRFLGWEGTDLDEPTLHVTVPKGSRGEREYIAVWEKLSEDEIPLGGIELDPTHNGKDDGVEADPKAELMSTTHVTGYRNEGVYTAKTVYTEFEIDGVMENAYTYGVRWKTDLSDSGRHTNTGTYFISYIVRGQDGKAHVFVEVHDADIVINDELWAAHYYRCDSIHVYYEPGNAGSGHSMWTFAAEPTKKYTKRHPENWTVVMTDYGYNVEFEFDNQGRPFMEGDSLGISIFLNDAYNYVDLNSYKKDTIKVSTKLNPASESYKAPSAAISDSISFSLASATGKVDVRVEDLLPEKTGDLLTDMINGALRIGLVIADNASPATMDMAWKAYSALSCYGIRSTIVEEDALVRSDFDSLIFYGLSALEENALIFDDLGYHENGFGIYGNNIVVYGAIEKDLEKATLLLSSLLAYAKDGGRMEYLATAYAETRSILVGGEKLPKLEGIELITDAGDNSYHLMKTEAEAEDFTAYCAALELAGFTKYTVNTMGTVSCATYYSNKIVVNVTYDSANERDLHVVVDPLTMTNLPPLQAETYEKQNDSTVTFLSPNALTVIFKLDNGEFLVVDSGTNRQPSFIYNELMKQSEDGKPVIAAWIFTHFHQDHNGGFVEFVQNKTYMSDVTIKSLIYNNPHQQVIDLASSLDQENMSKWPSLIQTTRADLYQARTGQRYIFANAEIEFLFTYEDIMPFWIMHDRSNPTSMVFSITVDGQKFMMTGDASREGLQNCVERYGEYLKSDFVQLSHHGQGDGGSPVEFYQMVDADYVYNPGTGTCASAEKWASNNAKSVYIRDNGTTVLTIPHKKEKN